MMVEEKKDSTERKKGRGRQGMKESDGKQPGDSERRERRAGPASGSKGGAGYALWTPARQEPLLL